MDKKKDGRPAFIDALFLKLYLYAYLNGIRSSRKLEREAIRNIELQWLLQGLHLNYHSIADFRKINAVALQNLFKLFVSFLKEAGLVDGKVIAVDGTKIRGNNSKKNNYNPKKIQRHLDYIEQKSKALLEEFEQTDACEDDAISLGEVQEKLARLQQHNIKYEALQDQLAQSQEPQVSTTDPDAKIATKPSKPRQLNYARQLAVDDKHHVITSACASTAGSKDRAIFAEIMDQTIEI